MKLLVVAALLGDVPAGAAASGTRPTSPPGANTLVLRADSVYCFLFNADTLFTYSIENGPFRWQTGGTFHALQARTQKGRAFRPSQLGGVSAWLGGADRNPWDEGVTFTRLTAAHRGDTVRTDWRMRFDTGDSVDYTFRFHVSGRTLVIRVEADSAAHRATGVVLDRSGSDEHLPANIVRIPMLTMFNALNVDGSFCSMFFDWEVTQASVLKPLCGVASPSSVWFAQDASYRGIGGKRRPLRETVYLTVSPELEGVLPNIPAPSAPRMREAAARNILSYNEPYPFSVTPRPDCDPARSYSFLDSIARRGVRELAVLFKVWNRLGQDCGYPNTLPANSFRGCDNSCRAIVPPADSSGSDSLRRVLDHVVNRLGFSAALHENYVDYYRSAGRAYDPRDRALGPSGEPILGWINTDCSPPDTSFILKPGSAPDYVRWWSGHIRAQIFRPPLDHHRWSYLDVHSSADPSVRVDHDTSAANPGKDSAAMFLYTLTKYRQLAALLRESYSGPVQGEGGNHFLYAGYFDDFEGRIQTGDESVFGVRAPLLVDFDLLRIRPKSAQHGVGHYFNFYAPTVGGVNKTPLSPFQVQQFIATELAFARGGLTSKDHGTDHAIEQAVLEHEHVLPVSRAVADADPVRIEYWHGSEGPFSASEYIRRYPAYADHAHSAFMARVKVTYDNGVVVCVNRSSESWSVDVGSPGGWFTRNVDGAGAPIAGVAGSTRFSLKPGAGWVCYVPDVP